MVCTRPMKDVFSGDSNFLVLCTTEKVMANCWQMLRTGFSSARLPSKFRHRLTPELFEQPSLLSLVLALVPDDFSSTFCTDFGSRTQIR